MTVNVIIKFQFEGVHSWPDCPLDEVLFLRSPHRHIFHVVAKKYVDHDDRDIEIIMLKRSMETYVYEQWNGDLHSMSCEMIARHLLNIFALAYCSVLEDGENGAEVIR